jgi:hypothetical protein
MLNRPMQRTPDESAMFGPARMRIHPIFTQVKSFTGDAGKPDGIEAEVEFEDQFGDPTKAAGTIRFELYPYDRADAEPRGERISQWSGSLLSLDQEQLRWNRTSRTYSFQLAAPGISLTRSYVLTAVFEHEGGRRYFSRVILEGQIPIPEAGGPPPPLKPTTAPTTQQDHTTVSGPPTLGPASRSIQP